MNLGSAASSSIGEYFDVFDEAIDRALAFGRPGDWSKPHSRVDRIRQRLAHHDAAHAAPPVWAYRLEATIWIHLLRETLLPSAQESIVSALRSTHPDGQLGVWSPLCEEDHTVKERAWRLRFFRSQAAVRAALANYQREPRYARIEEGVRALDSMVAAWVDADPAWGADTLQSEAERLASALDEILPPLARILLRGSVRDDFWASLDPDLVRDIDRSQGWFPHHRIPDLGFWYPVWQRVSPSKGHQEETGEWFEPEAQAIYEKAREREQQREQQEAAERTEVRGPSDEASLEDAVLPGPAEGELLRTPDEVQAELVGGGGRRAAGAGSARPAETRISFGDMYQTLWLERHEDLDELAIRARYSGPTRRAEPFFTADQLLAAWCEVRGVTPKHLIPANRAQVTSLLVARFGCRTRQEVTTSDSS